MLFLNKTSFSLKAACNDSLAFRNCWQNVLRKQTKCAFVGVCTYYRSEHVGEQVHNYTNMQSQIQIHLRSYLCTHEMWLCVGGSVHAWAQRHLKTTSPHWKLIFMLFSQSAKTRECVGSSMFDPPGSQPSYPGIWLRIQVDFTPPGGNREGDGRSSPCSSWSVRTSLRLLWQRLIDLTCVRMKENSKSLRE